MQTETLPVHLITGLLGSGKTTTLQHLITQKPAQERWGILINEFGDIDIDAATLESSRKPQESNPIQITQVSGGCVCCTAQFGLVQAINTLLQQPIDRLWIEPTGLGHPAKILDTLKQTPFTRPLELQAINCVITPQQLTVERWQKSAVMRDLVNLADVILMNKTDLATEQEEKASIELLSNLYPPKTTILRAQYGRVDLQTLFRPHNPQPFTLLQGLEEHLLQQKVTSHTLKSQLPDVQTCRVSITENSNQLNALGWVFEPCLQFNRVKLKAFFEWLTPFIGRAKGLLKTGNEWQLVNWSEESGLTFADIAWRSDSRLELIFKDASLSARPHGTSETPSYKDIEIQLLSCINQPK